MKKKLYQRMTLITVIVIIATMAITTGIFHNLFKTQVMEDLKTHVHILKTTEAILEYVEEDFDPQINNLRITVIGTDGIVQYDSNADIGNMENHGDRPEIRDAKNYGSGEAVRKSGTLDKNTYYYAERLSNGQILRVAKEAGSIWQFLHRILGAMIIELVVVIALCIIIARMLARQIVKPIEQMAQNLDVEQKQPIDTYKEIQPFIDKIYSQHEDLKKSTKIRQDFTANVSHELKTPLASISGYAELIETGMAKDNDIQHFAGEIYKSSQRLLALINDIIELSHLDVMDNELEKQMIWLDEMAAGCVEMLKMNAKKHEINIHTDILEKCSIMANADMMKEVIYNLCDNAIRYNKPNGSVWVSVYRERDKIILSVRDDGIGIPKEDRDRVFERFYRVDKARSKKTGGTGLGLAIVKHIAEQHNAEIVLDSELGKGTTISIKFIHK